MSRTVLVSSSVPTTQPNRYMTRQHDSSLWDKKSTHFGALSVNPVTCQQSPGKDLLTNSDCKEAVACRPNKRAVAFTISLHLFFSESLRARAGSHYTENRHSSEIHSAQRRPRSLTAPSLREKQNSRHRLSPKAGIVFGDPAMARKDKPHQTLRNFIRFVRADYLIVCCVCLSIYMCMLPFPI